MSLPRQNPKKMLRVIRRVSNQTTHGYEDDGLPMPVLRQKLKSGQQIYASCGTVARLTRKELRDRGYKARVVGTTTKLPFDGENDGHIMLEARSGKDKPWQLYDPDMNRQPLDHKGHSMNIQQFTRKGYSGRDRALGRDPSYNPDDPYFVANPQKPSEYGLNDPAKFYNRVLGTPTVYKGEKILYHDTSDPRVTGNPQYQHIGKRPWRKLMGLSQAMRKRGLNP